MRKEIFCGWLLAVSITLVPAIAMADGESRGLQTIVFKEVASVAPATNKLPSDAKLKTVYIVVGTNAVVPKDAYYSPSENRIYIKEGKYMMHYTVNKNPFYGQDSAKGKYKYCASDYFFDL